MPRRQHPTRRGRLQALVSGDGVDGSMIIHQDARLYAGLFNGDESATQLGYVPLPDDLVEQIKAYWAANLK
mgnify:CR=1 FL=1